MKIIISVFLLFISTVAFAQDKGTIQGVVFDKEANNEPLFFANVNIKNSKINASTDFDGIYNLSLDPGTYTLVFTFPGYEKIEATDVNVKSGKVTTLTDIYLSAIEGVSTEEVVAKANSKK